MAKKDKTAEASTETTAEVKAPRGIILNVDGREVRRVDLIKEMWAAGTHTRGEIKEYINGLGQGAPIPYQIVFAATKGLPGGRVVEKAPKAPKAEKKAKGAKGEAEAA